MGGYFSFLLCFLEKYIIWEVCGVMGWGFWRINFRRKVPRTIFTDKIKILEWKNLIFNIFFNYSKIYSFFSNFCSAKMGFIQFKLKCDWNSPSVKLWTFIFTFYYKFSGVKASHAWPCSRISRIKVVKALHPLNYVQVLTKMFPNSFFKNTFNT